MLATKRLQRRSNLQVLFLIPRLSQAHEGHCLPLPRQRASRPLVSFPGECGVVFPSCTISRGATQRNQPQLTVLFPHFRLPPLPPSSVGVPLPIQCETLELWLIVSSLPNPQIHFMTRERDLLSYLSLSLCLSLSFTHPSVFRLLPIMLRSLP